MKTRTAININNKNGVAILRTAMTHGVLIADYLAGPEILRQSVGGMFDEQLNAAPIPFKWSTRQVVFHISDFDLIYADHMKCVIAGEFE